MPFMRVPKCSGVSSQGFAILHRRSPSPVESWVGEPMTRYMLKWCYWRLAPPQRDWIVEEDFNFATADCKRWQTTFSIWALHALRLTRGVPPCQTVATSTTGVAGVSVAAPFRALSQL